MDLEKKLIAFMAIFITISLIYMFVKDIKPVNGVTTDAQVIADMKQPTSLSFTSKSTGSMDSDDAVIELMLDMSRDNSLELKFSINTHSVKLSEFDLKEITTLEYNDKVLRPVKASSIDGQHSSGTIVFDTKEYIGLFTVKIKGIPKIEERIYEWKAG